MSVPGRPQSGRPTVHLPFILIVKCTGGCLLLESPHPYFCVFCSSPSSLLPHTILQLVSERQVCCSVCHVHTCGVQRNLRPRAELGHGSLKESRSERSKHRRAQTGEQPYGGLQENLQGLSSAYRSAHTHPQCNRFAEANLRRSIFWPKNHVFGHNLLIRTQICATQDSF